MSQAPGHHLHLPCTLIPIRLCIWWILPPNSTLFQLLKPLYFLFLLEMGSLAKPSYILHVFSDSSCLCSLCLSTLFPHSSLKGAGFLLLTSPQLPPSSGLDIWQALPFLLTANSKTFPTFFFFPKKMQHWISCKTTVTHYSHRCCHLLILNHVPSLYTSFTSSSSHSLQHYLCWFQYHADLSILRVSLFPLSYLSPPFSSATHLMVTQTFSLLITAAPP